MKYYYTVYVTTNKANNKIYIGCHKTTNIEDDYLGSGKHLKRAIKKYGRDSFEKHILYVFDTPEDMFLCEENIVTESFVKQNSNYNLTTGGRGGFEHSLNPKFGANTFKDKANRDIARASFNRKMETDPVFREYMKDCQNRGSKKGVEARQKLYPQGTFKGKKHSNETKRKIGIANKIRQSGKNNNQYGKRWIHNLIEKRSTRIGKHDSLPEGWSEGRKIKF